MKRYLSILLCAVMLLALCACGNSAAAATETSTPAATPEPTETPAEEPAEELPEHGLKINGGGVIDLDKIDVLQTGTAQGHLVFPEAMECSQVYFTADISAEGLVNIYKALNWTPEGKTAVKISTGESSATYYLRPELIGDLTKLVNGTIVECNTAYEGNRTDSEAHYKLAEERGYTAIAEVDIMDSEGTMSIPVNPVDGGTLLLTEDIVGSHFDRYDSFIILSHFKGHDMAGFGGAIKNTSIGVAAAPEGKLNIHNGGRDRTHFLEEDPEIYEVPDNVSQLSIDFQKSMAEATKAVSDALDGNIIYINVMNNISVDCDCAPNPKAPDVHDVGILASYDPVALDQACLDLAACMDGSGTMLLKVANNHAASSLSHGETIGLGSRYYNLVSIDE